MKIISFSLWGNNPMYTLGALENIRLAKEIYPGWKCRFYIDKTVEVAIIRKILEVGGDVYKISNDRGLFYGMFWRFMVNDDPDVDIFISRDCDSRLNYRERGAVEEWENSSKCFHIMHDHYAHRSVPILGGMWGAKKGCINNLTDKINKWGNYNNKGIDQVFLARVVWPEIQNKYISHGGTGAEQWGQFRAFPPHKQINNGGTFVGEIYDQDNNPVVSI
jgi:protein O-GlcNAc transferase